MAIQEPHPLVTQLFDIIREQGLTMKEVYRLSNGIVPINTMECWKCRATDPQMSKIYLIYEALGYRLIPVEIVRRKPNKPKKRK